MTFYISAGWYEDCMIGECLKCREQFTINCDEDQYSFCPRCGVEIEPFTKKNPRWPQKTEWDTNNQLNGDDLYSKDRRLVIQYRSYNHGPTWGSIPLVKTGGWKSWHLWSHCLIGCMLYKSSASVHMVEKYHDATKKLDSVRLLLLHGKKYKVLKEKSVVPPKPEPVDFSGMCSGVMVSG